jgi:hypothetical protein
MCRSVLWSISIAMCAILACRREPSRHTTHPPGQARDNVVTEQACLASTDGARDLPMTSKEVDSLRGTYTLIVVATNGATRDTIARGELVLFPTDPPPATSSRAATASTAIRALET